MVGISVEQAGFAVRGERRKAYARFLVQGELDMSTVPLLESHLESVDRTGEDLILDLAGLTFIDSSGIHALSRAAARADENDRQLDIVNCRSAVERVFGLTGTTDLLGSPFGLT